MYREWLEVLEEDKVEVENKLNELFGQVILKEHEKGKEGILTIDTHGNLDIYFENKEYVLKEVSKGIELEIIRIDCDQYKNLKGKEDIKQKMDHLKNKVIPDTINKLYEDIRGWALEES
ncbi:hypothetical protein AB8U03_05810 [Clostridium sp. Mt-5]|uniref:Uncharacterized protein n=1 Tax=Clostridium moutaii TaxID=3240932 RepID=A0ABV4BNR7_9CLOT